MSDKNKIDAILKALSEGTKRVRRNPTAENYRIAEQNIEKAGKKNNYLQYYLIASIALLILFYQPIISWFSLYSSQSTKSQAYTPQQFVVSYYTKINNRYYQDAWNDLSTKFQKNSSLLPNGYKSYVDWWDQVKNIEVNNARLVSKNDNSAIVEIVLQYSMKQYKTLPPPESLRLWLIWNSSSGKWAIDNSAIIN